MKFTYDPQGTGENYGIQFEGDIKLFLKTIVFLFLDKKLAFPLRSHHGTTFRLKDYNWTLNVCNLDYTILNKGSGTHRMQLILSDPIWYKTINEYGATDNRQGRLTFENKQGFIYILKNLALEITRFWNLESGNSVSISFEDKVKFVGFEDPYYNEAHEDMLSELNYIAESFNKLNKTLN